MAMNKPDGRVAIQFAACRGNREAREEAFTRVHDALITNNPRRNGPVQVSWYAASAARDQLRIALLADHPETPRLLSWLDAHPGSELVIGMVEVPS